MLTCAPNKPSVDTNINHYYTMGGVSLILIALLCTIWAGGILSCPKNDYTYNVVDLSEPQMRALGEYIVKRLKVARDQKLETCHLSAMAFLDRFRTDTEKFDSERLAGVFLEKYYKNPSDIFIGVEATENALKKKCTYNILITKDFPLRRFLLSNTTELIEEFNTEEDLLKSMAKEKAYKHVSVVDCQHYLYHLATTYGKNNISVSIVDRDFGELNEWNFGKLGYIGGFKKQGCILDDDEEW